MSVSIVIGGQYGSEGKGKVAYLWAKRKGAEAVVRVGGSNSGHTVYDDEGMQYVFRMLPTACLLEDVTAVLPAGSYIDIPVLFHEIETVNLPVGRLKIDPNAAIVNAKHKEEESSVRLQPAIGSTLSGTGAAVADRVRRVGDTPVLLAKDMPELAPYLSDTKGYLRNLINQDKQIVIEGTQGYGLSNYHAKAYPFATSRDTTAAGFLAETGLSPFDVEHVIMVIRSFPIRVAGHSGPLDQEIDWRIVSAESGAREYFEEKTTVTHNVRRVGRFSGDVVREAVLVNRPDVIVLNHIDYIDYDNKDSLSLSEKQLKFAEAIETEAGIHIDYCGNGEMILVPLG